MVRNRLRRRVRAVLEESASRLPPGALLVSLSPGAVERSPAQLRDDVTSLLNSLDRQLHGAAR